MHIAVLDKHLAVAKTYKQCWHMLSMLHPQQVSSVCICQAVAEDYSHVLSLHRTWGSDCICNIPRHDIHRHIATHQLYIVQVCCA